MNIPKRHRGFCTDRFCSIGVAGAIAGGAALGAVGSYLGGQASASATNSATNAQRKQYKQTRKDLMPWQTSGANALAAYNERLGLTGDAGYTEPPMYDAFNRPAGSRLPRYEGQGDFEFNLEDDNVYRFARDQGLEAATRHANAGGHNNSGNILDELARRSAGYASQYQNDAFNRQLAGSRENFNRGISEYGINTDRANSLYNRGVGEYNMGAARNTDIYGRDQNYLNRLSNLSGGGQNAAAQLGGFGAQSASNQGGYQMMNAANQNSMYQGINNAAQGSIANYLAHDLYSNNPNMLYGGGVSGPFG